jgi:hypothetical protein
VDAARRLGVARDDPDGEVARGERVERGAQRLGPVDVAGEARGGQVDAVRPPAARRRA